MQTSYFKWHNAFPFENAVGIAGRSPKWYSGKEYKVLAPKYWFFKKYKEDGDKDFYIEKYKEEVLSNLDAQKVYEDLGENATLLCWEEPGKFCHRHLVSSWLSESLGIEVKEFERESIWN
jgi:hypothetical protein